MHGVVVAPAADARDHHAFVPRKKALLIGISYHELARTCGDKYYELPGSYADVRKVLRLLQDSYGYRPEDIRILTDEVSLNATASNQPTRLNIIDAMRELVRDACAGDRLVFHFSGHGSQVEAPPDHIEEIDQLDEVLWPSDVKLVPNPGDSVGSEDDYVPSNHIIDNELKEILIDSLPAGVHLTILLDACHSGTGADLKYEITPETFGSSPVIGKNPFTRPQPQAGMMSKTMPNTLKGVVNVAKDSVDIHVLDTKHDAEQDNLPYVTSWSACLDEQMTVEKDSGGIFIEALIQTLKSDPFPTNSHLLKGMAKWLNDNNKSVYKMNPQLGSNHRSDVIRNHIFGF